MNIQFTPDRPVIETENIVINGTVVGWMKLETSTYHKESWWHCGFNLPGSISLIQGHGSSREAAVEHALLKGKEDAHRLMADIADLEIRLAR